MAFVFDASPGGVAANSWALVAEGDDYFAARRNASAWTALTTPEKEVALADGTRKLEILGFEGARASTTQRLRVPRSGLWDQDGFALPTLTIPTPFKHALFEQVLYDLIAGATDRTQLTGLEQFSSIEVPGAVSLELRDGRAPSQYAPSALQLLAPYTTTMVGATRLVRA